MIVAPVVVIGVLRRKEVLTGQLQIEVLYSPIVHVAEDGPALLSKIVLREHTEKQIIIDLNLDTPQQVVFHRPPFLCAVLKVLVGLLLHQPLSTVLKY